MTQEMISTILAFLVPTLMAVSYFIFFDKLYQQDRRDKIYFISIKFPQVPKSGEKGYLVTMKNFFTMLARVAENRQARFSFEIHHAKGEVKLQMTTSDQILLRETKRLLTQIDKVEFVETKKDLIDDYENKEVYSCRMVLEKDYLSINLKHSDLFREIVDYLANLADDSNSGVMFLFRPIFGLKERVREEYLKMKDPSRGFFEGVNKLLSTDKDPYKPPEKYKEDEYPDQDEALSSLRDKMNGGQVYQSEILLISGDEFALDTLSSLFETVRGVNSFRGQSKKLSFNDLVRHRMLRHRGIFCDLIPTFRQSIGSYLTSEEIATMIHPQKVERAKFKLQQNIILEPVKELSKDRKDAVLVGKSKLKTGEETGVYFPIDNIWTHVYSLARTGQGKTTFNTSLFLGLESKCKDKALIYLDPHGDILDDIALRIKNWDKTVYFNLAKSREGRVLTINPLFAFKTSLTQKIAKMNNLVEALRDESTDRKTELGTSMEKLLTFIIKTGVHFADAYYMYLLGEGVSPKRAVQIVSQRQFTLPDLLYVFQKGYDYESLILKIFKDYPDPDIYTTWKNKKANLNLSTMVVDGLDNRLRYIIPEDLVPVFEGNKFDIKQVVLNCQRLLMPINNRSFNRSSKKIIAKVLLSEIWDFVQTLDRNERPDTVVFVDEFQQAQMSAMEEMLAESRKYRIGLVLANQYPNQLKPEIRDAVMKNVSTVQIFSLDKEDSLKVAGLFNDKVMEKHIMNLPRYQGYFRTNNPETYELEHLTLNTIDYLKETPEYHTLDDLWDLNDECLKKYGEDKKRLYKNSLAKRADPVKWFLGGV